jgi:hypothetical protein
MGSWGGPFFEHESPLEYDNIWTKIKGNHTLKFGAQIKKVYFIRDDANARGAADFDQAITSDADVPGSGLGMASFLLGLPDAYNRRVPQSLPQEDQWRDGIFIQDAWKVTPKLTAILGYRWEYTSPIFGPKADTLVNVDFTTGNVILNGGSFGGKYMGIPPNYKEMSPRVGLAYRATEKTVVRAGYGRSYGLDIWGATNAWPSGSWPTAITQTVTQVNPYTPVFEMSDGPPTNPTPPAAPSTGLIAIPNGVSVGGNGTNTYWHTYVDSWNLTVQRQLSNSMAFEVAYVGNVTRHQWAPININAPVPGPGDYTGREPFYSEFGWTQGMTLGHAALRGNFHGLQARFDKRFSGGLEASTNFTWSKAIDEGEMGVDDPYDLHGGRGISSYNRELLSTSTLIWQLPFGTGKHFASDAKGFENAVIGGWQLTGILSLQSGIPYNPYMGDTSTLNSTFSLRPDRIGSGKISNPSRNGWFNPADFVTPPLYTEGDTSRNCLTGPDWAGTDLSLAKTFQLTERFKLQLRMDAINAFNRTNLTTPDATIGDINAGKIFGLITPMRRLQIGAHLRW